MKRFVKGLGAALAVCLAAGSADAIVVVTGEETGGDVVISYAGTIDITGLAGPFGATGQPVGASTVPNIGQVAVIASSAFDFYTIGPTPAFDFGPGGGTNADSFTGGTFLIQVLSGGNLNLGVPTGYSGGTLTGSATHNAASFASLGITPGSYTLSLPNDEIRFQFGAAVPLPAPALLLLGGLAALGAVRRFG
jgi:hypothetical protein